MDLIKMIPKIICFIFGHNNEAITNIRSINLFADEITYHIVDNCLRCGAKLI